MKKNVRESKVLRAVFQKDPKPIEAKCLGMKQEMKHQIAEGIKNGSIEIER